MFEEYIHDAYMESYDDTRRGDKIEELEAIQKYILSAKKIVIPNWNDAKVKIINQVLCEFNLEKAEHLKFPTSPADFSRMPALTKAQIALDLCDCDLIIARGRLGIPGSGSLMLFLDSKGRILTGSCSPSHVVHGKSLEDAIYYEVTECLERIGLTKE